METQVALLTAKFNENREANLKALLSCGYSATDKKAYIIAAMNWMISEKGIKAAFGYNGYSYKFDEMTNEEMNELCERASSEVMDTYCPSEAAEARKEGAAWENDRFGKGSKSNKLNAWN